MLSRTLLVPALATFVAITTPTELLAEENRNRVAAHTQFLDLESSIYELQEGTSLSDYLDVLSLNEEDEDIMLSLIQQVNINQEITRETTWDLRMPIALIIPKARFVNDEIGNANRWSINVEFKRKENIEEAFKDKLREMDYKEEYISLLSKFCHTRAPSKGQYSTTCSVPFLPHLMGN